MKITKEDVGGRIKKVRVALGLGQKELGNLTGTSKQSVSFYESGRSAAPLEFLAAVATLGKITLDDLITGKEHGSSFGDFSLPQKGTIATNIEPGESDARDLLTKQRATALTGGGGSHAQAKEGQDMTAAEYDSINIHEGLLMTTRVLQSETGYAQALWSNLKSFDEAVRKEEKVKDIERKMDLMLEKMSKMEERLAANAAGPEKRDKTANA
ncbi:MAG: helix-turn-helix domain-containing protein [Desulfobulbia bacterium]